MREESEREGGKGRRKEGWREGRGRNGVMEGREVCVCVCVPMRSCAVYVTNFSTCGNSDRF